ncbi:hypothetical protein LSAT2_003866 [Lamellibrachia satsuma]|nr:hypothetical protein LSAT2_003866 [Lamellibrachia satsuma]
MQPPVLSTAGAVAVRNEKGEFAMEKVKVSRYVSGKRPEYAPESSDEDEDVEFGLGYMKKSAVPVAEKVVAEIDDRRLKRLQQLEKAGDTEDRVARHRRLHEPEILAAGSDGEGEDEEMKEEEENLERDRGERRRDEMEESSEEEEEELDEEEIERRRALLRLKAVQQREEEEVMELEEEKREGSEGDSSEWEEYTDSEEEDAGPRLKPVFVRKKDRVTIQEKEKELIHQRELEQAAKRLADDRRRETLKPADLPSRFSDCVKCLHLVKYDQTYYTYTACLLYQLAQGRHSSATKRGC